MRKFLHKIGSFLSKPTDSVMRLGYEAYIKNYNPQDIKRVKVTGFASWFDIDNPLKVGVTMLVFMLPVALGGASVLILMLTSALFMFGIFFIGNKGQQLKFISFYVQSLKSDIKFVDEDEVESSFDEVLKEKIDNEPDSAYHFFAQEVYDYHDNIKEAVITAIDNKEL